MDVEQAKTQEVGRIADHLFQLTEESDEIRTLYWEECLAIAQIMHERGFAYTVGREHHIQWTVRGSRKVNRESLDSEKAVENFFKDAEEIPGFVVQGHRSRVYGSIVSHI